MLCADLGPQSPCILAHLSQVVLIRGVLGLVDGSIKCPDVIGVTVMLLRKRRVYALECRDLAGRRLNGRKMGRPFRDEGIPPLQDLVARSLERRNCAAISLRERRRPSSLEQALRPEMPRVHRLGGGGSAGGGADADEGTSSVMATQNGAAATATLDALKSTLARSLAGVGFSQVTKYRCLYVCSSPALGTAMLQARRARGTSFSRVIHQSRTLSP